MPGEQEIGKLIIRLAADISELKSELSGAQKHIKTFASSTNESVASLGKTISTIKSHWMGVAAAIGAVIAAYKGLEKTVGAVVTLGQQTERLQRATGLTAEEASTLIAVADQMGVGFNTLSNSITLITRKMGGLKGIEDMVVDASGKTVDVFEKFGIQIKNADGTVRTVTDILGQMRDVIRNAGSETERMTIATQFFRNSSQEMLEFLILTDEQFKAIAEDAKKYGIVLTSNTVVKTKEFVMATRDLNDAILGLKIAIGKELLPMVTTIVKEMTGMVSQFKAFKEEFDLIFFGINTGLKTVLIGVMGLFTGATTIFLGLMEINRELLEMFDFITFHSIPGMDKMLAQYEIRQQKVIDSLYEQTSALHKLMFGEPEKPGAAIVTKPKPKIAPPPEETEAQRTALEKLRKKYEELGISLLKLESPIKADRKALEEFIVEAIRGVEANRKLTEMLEMLRTRFEQLYIAQAIAAIREKTTDLKIELIRLEDPLKADSMELENWIEKITDGISMTKNLSDSIGRLKESYKKLTEARIAAERTEAERKAMQILYGIPPGEFEGPTDLQKAEMDLRSKNLKIMRDEFDLNRKIAEVQFEERFFRISKEEALRKEIGYNAQLLQNYEEQFESLTFASERYDELQRKIDEARIRLKELNFQLKEQTASLGELMDIGLRKYTKQLKDEMINIFEFLIPNVISTGTDAIGGFFDDLIDGSKSVKEAFADMANNFAKNILKMVVDIGMLILKMQILKALGFGGGLPVTGFGMEKGGTFLATRPTSIHVGEGSKPELINVIPLSRGISSSMLTHGMPELRPLQSFAGGGNIITGGGSADFRELVKEIRRISSVNIANITSTEELDRWAASAQGQGAILNVISSRAGQVKRLLR